MKLRQWKTRYRIIFWLACIAVMGVILSFSRVFSESDLFFPQGPFRSQLPAYAEALAWVTGEDITLSGASVGEPERGVMLYFYGNGEQVDVSLERMRWLAERSGMRIICFDYRGYGRSGGVPRLDDLLQDAEDALETFRVTDKPVIVYGRSLGTVCAIHLAAGHRLDGIILEAPFTTADDVGKAWSRSLPVWVRPFLSLRPDTALRNRKQPLAYMEDITEPMLVIHGAADDIIPVALGVRMFDAAASAEKAFCLVPDRGHNNLDITRDPAATAVQEMVASCLKGN